MHVTLPFKDQTSVNAVKRQMRGLSHKIGTTLHPIFISGKLEQDLKPREIKPPIVKQQCVVYSFACDLCDSYNVGFTARLLLNELLNIKTLPSVNTLREPTGIQASSKKASFVFQKSAKIVLSTRCFSSRNAILVSAHRLIPFEQDSLFKRTFHHLLSF